MTCLEIGAGFGSIALWLANEVGENGLVIATEVKSDCLSVLNTYTNPNLIVKKHDIATDEIDSTKFDIIHSRFVLEHLPTREQVIKKLIKALKPGGWLFIEDADYSTITLTGSAAYMLAMQHYVSSIESKGSDYSWTIKIPHLFSAENLESVEAKGNVEIFRGGSEQAKFFMQNLYHLRAQLYKSGLKTEDLNKALLDLNNPNLWFSGPLVLSVFGRKPQI
ncbi:methyltransferase [Caldifermentibacillus hisashii]|uniref:class I SAM-dependent methyltransferase n=1 Tax=Caldifermentibacillus hisashii TaxID=996558 RepID=UPI0031FD90EF